MIHLGNRTILHLLLIQLGIRMILHLLQLGNRMGQVLLGAVEGEGVRAGGGYPPQESVV